MRQHDRLKQNSPLLIGYGTTCHLIRLASLGSLSAHAGAGKASMRHEDGSISAILRARHLSIKFCEEASTPWTRTGSNWVARSSA